MTTTLITGANRGIGLSLVQQHVARGDRVIAICRARSEELAATGAEIHEGVDVTDAAAIARVVAAIGNVVLDRVILNAGVLRDDSVDDVSFEDVRSQIEVNAIAPLQWAKALRPRLARGSKLALITSRMGSMADNGSGGYYGYRMSKAALNAAGVSLARDLAGAGIAVVLVHPGYVRTGMTAGAGNVGPHEAAQGIVARIDELTLATSGSFVHANGTPLPF
ncbi:SDR family oxidoreductase [Sandaracinus amylolyticus]|uniref:SDR family oxidoreductase n=1 Tax=Sandaracinus amylolyticus TaxID=927083 RepID=UPI001F1BD92A|nr:SDR family oxidoreductase [Sandaracinus amylolyticus]UJR80298.1 Short-subunit dehydrogenase [Sandaracinus amylolyticus]